MVQSAGLIRVEPCTRQSLAEWVALRRELWPQATLEEHSREAQGLLSEPGQATAFLAISEEGTVVAFAEAALRHDYVNGCTTSPVAFLEGIYVDPAYRKQGIARLLCKAVEDWAIGLGCSELASDVELQNTASQNMHAAIGFEETERVVYYRKPLSTSP